MKKIITFLAAAWLSVLVAAAGTYTVTQTTDDGTGATSGSLSWAINSVADGDVINFNLSSGDVITLSAALPTIDNSLTMEGINAATGNRVTIQVASPGVSTFRVFYIDAIVTMNDLILRGGNVTGDGGVITCGTGTLNRCVIKDGNASGRGGGLYGGLMKINQCTVNNNTAAQGGGLYFGNYSSIINSTITDNVATSTGGGIFLQSSITCYIINTTITGNTAPSNSGGGVFNSSNYAYTHCFVLNSIMINNTGGDFAKLNVKGRFFGYYSWSIGTWGGTNPFAPKKSNAYTTGDLGGLTDNGGPTPTMALSSLAPAYHAGGNAYYNATNGYYFRGTDNQYYKFVDTATGFIDFTPTNPETDKITTDQRGATRGATPSMGAYDGTLASPEIDLKQGSTAITSSTGTYDFGSHDNSTNTDVVFTIENTGTAASTLSSFAITGTDAAQFSLQGTNPTTVANGSSTTFTVRFTPTSAGSKTATVSFANQDANENPYSFTITGTGDTPMQLVFKTTADNQSISLPLIGLTNCTVNWGDGSTASKITQSGFAPHTYADAGTYTVNISGTISNFGNGEDSWPGAKYLTEVASFGDVGLTSLGGGFMEAINLSRVPALLPSTITSLSFCFASTNKESITNLNLWDVRNVTDMQYMFFDTKSFNQDISGWNITNATNMNSMFMLATAFNQNISDWNVSHVANMSMTFAGASSFNQPIGNWNVSQVKTMAGMFYAATSFNQNIASWNIGKATEMNGMFEDANLSTANYDAILIGWAAQTVKPNVVFGGGNNKYSAGTAATARGVLTSSPNSWIITDGGLSITTAVKDKANLLISIYPNPAKDFVRIKGISGNALVTITDLNGQTCLQLVINANTNVPVNHLTQGIYLLKIQENGTTKRMKLIIK